MVNDLKAEFLKQKHRFTLKLLWLSPLIPIVFVIILMNGRYFMEGAFNWWYTMILPGSLAMIVAFGVSAEKKHNHHGLLSVCADKKRLWISQVLMNTILLLLLNLIFFICLTVSGVILGCYVSFMDSLVASFILFLTFMWQIPVFMYVSEKTGSISSILISLICNMGFGILFAPTKLWYIPFAIPARLMCPVIKVLPNGIQMEYGNPLANDSVIFTGISITVAFYCIFSLLTTFWFSHREVR